MDITFRLQECFAKLDYFGTIPIPLISNPSTSFIWEQFIRNVKPKNEVDACRKNIIINRLQKKPSVKNSEDYPIREIQVYNELKVVKENIAKIKKRIQEKQNKEVCLQEANKSNYLQLNSLKEHIENKKIKLHILKLKSSDIENEIKQIDTVINAKGLAWVSDEDSQSLETVSKILQILVEKIENLTSTEEFPGLRQNRYMMSANDSVSTIKSPPKKWYSTIKKNKNNSSRIQRFGSCANMNAVKSLFTDSFKENDFNAGNVIKGDNNDSKLLDQSAQLLPDACFDFKADDEFLMSFRSNDDVLYVEEYNHTLKKKSAFDNSLSSSQLQSQARLKYDYFQNAHIDEFVMQNIDEILHGANVRIIWASLCNLRENLLRNIRVELESSKTNVRFKNNGASEEDISKLNFIYVKNNLLTLKNKKIIKRLMQDIKEKKSYIEDQLGEHIGENRLKGLELMLENVKLEAAIEFMQKEINYSDKNNSMITLNSINSKIHIAKEELFVKIKEIEGYMESKEYLMQQLKKCQNDTMMYVRNLSQFIYDPVWTEGLTEDVNSNEIAVFRDFPLDYNKKFCFTDNSFYRDSMRTVIIDEDTPSDTLYMIRSLIQHPQYPPERIFIETMKKKHQLKVMSSLKFPEIKLEQKNYSLQEFREQEKYVDKICETLTSNIRSWKTYQVLNSTSRMKSNMDLWLNMPFKRFISKDRMVDGKSYKEYEDKYDHLRNNK